MTPLAGRLLREWGANGRRWEGVARAARRVGLRVWNPARYALPAYTRYLEKFPPRRGAILALGLNPGPYGMAQTGIPFTDCRTAARRLGIHLELPGLAPDDLRRLLHKPGGGWKMTYERSSLGIYRFLDLAWGGLEKAYANWYVGNPCPLLFLEPDGANVTPADTRLRRLDAVRQLRQVAVERFASVLKPRGIVCLGKDVAQAVGETAENLVGAANVVRYRHPAREAPEAWARGLVEALRSRGLIDFRGSRAVK